ncbi:MULTISPECIES: DUF3489 domain-containing protein [Seohaeicola]|uniref:DUF3489 domain-containing protein n=1 Tax=Seohaeicola TaxID=481178 RepID=UPI0035CEE7FF
MPRRQARNTSSAPSKPRSEGASISEIVEATGWLSHSARGLISGGLKKKLGLPITAQKLDQRGTVYRLPAV